METTELTYLSAILEAEREEMERDPNVILIGEDIALYSASGVLGKLDAKRTWNAPISELGFSGMAIGAAITGLRPIVDLTIASFVYLASDQIINQAAKLHYMTGGQVRVPVVFRMSMWHNGANAAQHSDRPYPMFMNVPGLKIIAPATPSDMKGMLKSAIRDDDPVIVFEDNDLWSKKEQVPTDPDCLVPLGKAAVKREGSDVTIVSVAGCLLHALPAADLLAKQGISAEVIDVRSLVPLDKETILASVSKTGRLVVVDYANRTLSAASEIAAIVAEEAFDTLKAPIQRVTTPDVHIPFSPKMERPLYPNKDRIVAAATSTIR
ncbi:MAG: alpha-ketoacid dehydrogenase subunit beta [Pseudomonadales bacterium]|jgi:pyruvate/2-oxoglutarate/acetoin dehydrogenase E1 component|nr:alpha-ketoacid dehydrogenase subunit beta [Pseudomonadales bacterium]MCP5338174.1 alpha-ketoacid dehydrogenase subunit beta [Pseudomonadales bacterium]